MLQTFKGSLEKHGFNKNHLSNKEPCLELFFVRKYTIPSIHQYTKFQYYVHCLQHCQHRVLSIWFTFMVHNKTKIKDESLIKYSWLICEFPVKYVSHKNALYKKNIKLSGWKYYVYRFGSKSVCQENCELFCLDCMMWEKTCLFCLSLG